MRSNEYLTYCRKHAKVTQYRLALTLGVTQQLVSAWEAGRTPIPTYRLPDLEHHVGMDPAYMHELLTAEFSGSLTQN